MAGTQDMTAAFLEAANGWHNDGGMNRAQAILASNPEVATASIHTAAVLGDDKTVRRFLNADPALVSAPAGPNNWDPLTHLCFSDYLRSDRTRSPTRASSGVSPC